MNTHEYTQMFPKLEKVSNVNTSVNTIAHSHWMCSFRDADSPPFLEGGLCLPVAGSELLQAGDVAVVDQFQPVLLQLVRGAGGGHLSFRLRSVRGHRQHISSPVSVLTTPKRQQHPPN